ncbi:nickel transporter permease [Natrialba asiatica]|uniref:Peptide ABC transporter permease n=1 Tax=Natrialba asiatica (strain ATCC 700177 / DSM 12278 / JCM 9576 / FERM P-10747 / NBRC 102637 / 172P1) TaxID=29540 RepID=M0AYN5_NATA1|nr:nickel transporter permease [Natrialba asiatica]ELZ02509.1 peptide ABC transporter permease [Natrialba asiatica DSM 12278]
MSKSTPELVPSNVGLGGLCRRYRRFALQTNTAIRLGGGVIWLLVLVALVGPVVSPYDPTTQVLEMRLRGPSLAHPLGTDALGRDVATRLAYGARVSLALALAATLVRLVLGTAVGLLAATGGRLVDVLLMRLVDVQLAFPGLVLALVIAGVLGPSLRNVVIALSIVGWASYARVVRGTVLSIKARPFVQSATLYGTPWHRLVKRHLLPHVVNPVIVLATLNLGTVVLAAAGLSYLGLGAQPPTAEWGSMIADGRNYMRSAPWLVTAPGVAIMATVIGFNLLGDGLRDRLDPDHLNDRQRRRT